MRLAVFTSRYPGRVSTFFERDMCALLAEGIEVDIFPLRPHDPSLWRYSLVVGERQVPPEQVHHLGLVDCLRSARLPRRLGTLVRDATAVTLAAARYGPAPVAKTWYTIPKALAWAAKNGRPYDHVLAYWGGYPATCAYLFHRLLGRPIPFSIWLHAGADLYYQPVHLRQKLLYADNVITCIEFNRAFLLERYAEIADRLAPKIHVSYHGLDLAAFPYQPDGRPPRRIIAVGRFAPDKGFDDLLRAAAALRHLDLEIELVGDGPEAGALRALAGALGLGDRVSFRGWLPFGEVRSAMRAATLLVHPSSELGDGLPNVIREAMALGTPVVASRVAGIPEAVDGGRCGVLVPPRNVRALADAIARLIADEAERRRLAERARARVEQLFDLWANGARLADLLRATPHRAEGARRRGLTVTGGFLLRLYHRLPAPARSAAATVHGFRLRRWRHGPEREQLMCEALARERWSREEWSRWTEECLARQLERAATRVPYYRQHWQARRARGDRASWELLENWPILEKDAVRANPLAFVAEDCDPRNLQPEHTSGTTGQPLVVFRSRHTVESLYALSAARTRAWHGVAPDARYARLGGRLVVPAAQRRPPFWVWNAALRQLYLSSYHLAPDLLPYYLDALRRYNVRLLDGFPSSLHLLAQEALRRGRLELRMQVAFTNAEPLAEHQRAAISSAFDCPVRETYGMAETVAWASECEAGRLHQWPEVGIVEVLEGELICTGLLNPDMPLIRYRVGDRGRLAPPGASCPCGRTLPLVDVIEGRSTDLLVTRDGRRVFWLNPVWYGLPVREAQIIQDTLNRVRVLYAPAPGFNATAARTVVDRLRDRLGEVEVLLQEVDAVPRSASGKVRAVVCNLGPGEFGIRTHGAQDGCGREYSLLLTPHSSPSPWLARSQG